MENIWVIIAGEVKDRGLYRELQAWCGASRIVIVGKWIDDKEIQIFFNACDVVVLPYTEVTTSGVIPLAYSFSRPVIASAIGGLCEVVNEQTGILVPPGDDVALRVAIGDFFQRDRLKMEENAYNYAKEHLSWEETATRIGQLYQRMAWT